MTIGILAYGSLIGNPGNEIKNATENRIRNVKTPFKVEFARSSTGRDGAPTLIPVEDGGAYVNAVIFVLKEHVTEKEAKDMLYRREMNKVGSQSEYSPPENPGPNNVLVEEVDDFYGVDKVFYTKIGANIDDLTPQDLAKLAIESAKEGAEKRDGISYLINAKKNGVRTPLMPEYEKEILRQTGTQSLEEAWETLVHH
ncbi:MAG: hypothetical protein FE043_03755 [Thermoplasmata archaeon]|nr:MAG: hypothetical protein FE043_03755 [Thermoplasmata archaeon]